MRAALILAAAAGASAASLDAPLLFSRQSAAIAGCEDQCNPVMDWAYTCRTDVNKCMDECDAELLATADQCVVCMQTTNPEEAVRIQGRVDPIRQMCGGAAASPSAASSASSAAAETPAASSDPAAAPSSAAAAPSASAAASSASAVASASASASASGSAAAAAASTPAAASSSVSAPSASNTSGAGKVSLSLGAIAAAAAAYLL
ncbi:uncharacterized protein COLE_04196 [Cutaneotrichosporon oleaginosum]|uniref:uncharacterized protein n=1 Tax=Cutaneotrichosporon oleaginosum TaxID=879819 RepID=UPI0013234A32|nr:hypothetical protein COLE_04196 [Cutaneotrichosporon oleaginosum]